MRPMHSLISILLPLKP